MIQNDDIANSAQPARDARHARLFELIRQHSLAADHAEATATRSPAPAEAPQKTVAEFAEVARKSLLPQEQAALGISASFGR